MTLTIKDKSLREKFEELELEGVQRRWEIATAIFLTLHLLNLIFKIKDVDRIVYDQLNDGGISVGFVIFTLLGRKWKHVHHYSILVYIFGRAFWTMVNIHLKRNDVEPFASNFNYILTVTASLLRAVTPVSLLFLTHWKLFLCFIFPFSIIMHAVLFF